MAIQPIDPDAVSDSHVFLMRTPAQTQLRACNACSGRNAMSVTGRMRPLPSKAAPASAGEAGAVSTDREPYALRIANKNA